MERLTDRGYKNRSFMKEPVLDEEERMVDIIARLAAYEDTGLEPDEIKELCTDDVAEAAKMFRKMIESGEIDHLRELLQAEKDRQKLYLLALNTWGADAQTLMVFEEMSELEKELCKHARGKKNQEAIAEEIADVQIMLEQMMVLHDCNQAVREYKEIKLLRLGARLGLTREEAEYALKEENNHDG